MKLTRRGNAAACTASSVFFRFFSFRRVSYSRKSFINEADLIYSASLFAYNERRANFGSSLHRRRCWSFFKRSSRASWTPVTKFDTRIETGAEQFCANPSQCDPLRSVYFVRCFMNFFLFFSLLPLGKTFEQDEIQFQFKFKFVSLVTRLFKRSWSFVSLYSRNMDFFYCFLLCDKLSHTTHVRW